MSRALQIRNNATDGAFEAVLDDEVVGRVGYRLRQDRVVLTHTEVDEAHRGQGIAKQLVRAALDDIAATGRRLMSPGPGSSRQPILTTRLSTPSSSTTLDELVQ